MQSRVKKFEVTKIKKLKSSNHLITSELKKIK